MSSRSAGGPHILADGNPFSTRHVRPGAIAYLFSGELTPAEMLRRLETNGWQGEIVGPHGCGKSTLLATLIPLLEQADRQIERYSLREGDRHLPISRADWRAWTNRTQVIVDGYKQLSWWQRRWLGGVCRRQGAGLLVTAHVSVGLPHLVQISPSLEVLQTVVTQLIPGGCTRITPADVARLFRENHGNAREVLFGLYDLYELRGR